MYNKNRVKGVSICDEKYINALENEFIFARIYESTLIFKIIFYCNHVLNPLMAIVDVFSPLELINIPIELHE